MKIKNILLLALSLIICMSFVLIFSSCDEDTQSSDSSSSSTSSSTEESMPSLSDIFSFPEGGIELPDDELE